ncbi:MAG: hypothetical protein FWC80_07675, partial [Firmicutes bacterium]|nr:hypothetical protein [Bacillota bacterium]
KATEVAEKDVSGYAEGMTVKHRKFGLGKIIKTTDAVGGSHAEISFEGVGTLTLALNYAPLEIVD